MTLEDLIDPLMRNPGTFPATLGVFFPQKIELPGELHTYFGKTWLDSEHRLHEEIGGNLIWVVDEYGDEPVVTAENERRRPRSQSVGPSRPASLWHRPPGAAPRRDDTWTVVKPEDVSTGTEGNSVNIRDRRDRVVVGDFHTHPSTPGGKNQSHCGYQPPSIEDLMGFKAQEVHGKAIFVKFVIARTSDVYAMVYIRGVSKFNDAVVFEKIKSSLDAEGDRIKFPSQKAKEKYWSVLGNDPMNGDLKRKLDNEAFMATDFGEKFAEQGRFHLKWACYECGIGLYCGPVGGPLIKW